MSSSSQTPLLVCSLSLFKKVRLFNIHIPIVRPASSAQGNRQLVRGIAYLVQDTVSFARCTQPSAVASDPREWCSFLVKGASAAAEIRGCYPIMVPIDGVRPHFSCNSIAYVAFPLNGRHTYRHMNRKMTSASDAAASIS